MLLYVSLSLTLLSQSYRNRFEYNLNCNWRIKIGWCSIKKKNKKLQYVLSYVFYVHDAPKNMRIHKYHFERLCSVFSGLLTKCTQIVYIDTSFYIVLYCMQWNRFFSFEKNDYIKCKLYVGCQCRLFSFNFVCWCFRDSQA